jgi:DNA invertase Pin-like site-specific DNA recombinase
LGELQEEKQMPRVSQVICCRTSGELQNPGSGPSQEHEVREGLAHLGIDANGAIVINEKTEAGTHHEFPGIEQLMAMAANDELSLVAVVEASRLGRSTDTFAIIQDFASVGVRFISTRDGSDCGSTL